MACSQGSLLLVGSGRRISGLERDGAVQISLDGPDGCRSREDAGAVEASLSPAARTLRRLLGSLPVRTTGYAIAEALLGSSPDQAVAELRMAGLLEDGGAAGRFRLSDDAWRRSQPVEEDLRTVTGACLAVVERAAALVAGGASGKQRRAAWETLDREQHMVSHLLDRISGLPWHREKWRLAAALLPLYGERTYSSWWRQNLTHGIDGAFVDGAMDVLAGLYAQLACMELRYGDDERRAETAAECAGDLLGQVGSGRVRGRIWQARAEVAERFWGDPVPGWREAHRWWEAEGEQAAADAADVRLGEALLADGQAEQALAVLAGGRETRELAGARARLVRAAAHRALERPGLALAEAVVAAEEAVRTRQYRLYDQSLRLLCDLAEGQGDDGRLLRVCRARRTELGDATGLGVRWLEAGPSEPAGGSRPRTGTPSPPNGPFPGRRRAAAEERLAPKPWGGRRWRPPDGPAGAA